MSLSFERGLDVGVPANEQFRHVPLNQEVVKDATYHAGSNFVADLVDHSRPAAFRFEVVSMPPGGKWPVRLLVDETVRPVIGADA